jgi:formamidopyrimidine-DNA glycosylase
VPELPEIQAMVERLEPSIGGATFERADVLQFSSLKTVTPRATELAGRAVTGLSRRGKFALIELGGPRIAFHLSQGGRLDIEMPPKQTKPRGAVVRFRFERAPSVLVKEFGRERKAGWWVLAEGDDGPLANLGPEPDSDGFATFVLDGADGRRVHTILRDQRTVAGIGRGYSDDILHRAKLSPFASLDKLDAEHRRTLLDAIHDILDEALVAERKRGGGLPTKIGDHFTVHGRSGTPCPVCGDDLRRVSYESHEVTYCPTCQTGGKRLNDRRMDRLLR